MDLPFTPRLQLYTSHSLVMHIPTDAKDIPLQPVRHSRYINILLNLSLPRMHARMDDWMDGWIAGWGIIV